MGYTTHQSNTHSTESREVLYPWHPWYGRTVWIHDVRVTGGQAAVHCGLEQSRLGRAVAIPQWMFDTAICCQMRIAQTPMASAEALLELKALLSAAKRSEQPGIVIEAQHHCLLGEGGADATHTKRRASNAAQAVSSVRQGPLLGRAATHEIRQQSVCLLARLLYESWARGHGVHRAEEARDD